MIVKHNRATFLIELENHRSWYHLFDTLSKEFPLFRHWIDRVYYYPPCPNDFNGVSGRFGVPKENEQETKREAICKYADLTSRVTFVGRCTSRQIARVRLYSVPRSAVHKTRTGATHGGAWGERRGKLRGVHRGGYRSLISVICFIRRGPSRSRLKSRRLHSLPLFLFDAIVLSFNCRMIDREFWKLYYRKKRLTREFFR